MDGGILAPPCKVEKSIAMGLTYVAAIVTGPSGKSRTVELLVDSGASYSLLPADVWRELELEPQETLEFFLADGTKIQRDASECKIRLNGKERHTPVILGVEGDEPLLGVITLENLGLMLDPFKRSLHAMKLRLA
jgi:clan AA aspartic protease